MATKQTCREEEMERQSNEMQSKMDHMSEWIERSQTREFEQTRWEDHRAPMTLTMFQE